ncbi:MAG: TonB family protein [Vicingaceae bacterium]|nr:TonB family protein [Vicingaceae bacterium]
MNHFQKTTKKNERMRFVYFQLGLLISFSLTFFAFEWTTYYSVKELKGVKVIDDDIETVLPPVNPEVEKPIVKTEFIVKKIIDKIVIVDNNTAIEKPTEKETPYEAPKFDDKWVKVETPVIDPDPIDYPDEMPGFIGGDKALFQYLSNNIKYPKIEIKRGVEGRVYVEFVVGKNGEISDIKILRGVSEAIDAEAIRVIKAMPNWLPGKQKGRTVKVRYKMSISFKLIK